MSFIYGHMRSTTSPNTRCIFPRRNASLYIMFRYAGHNYFRRKKVVPVSGAVDQTKRDLCLSSMSAWSGYRVVSFGVVYTYFA